MHEQRTACHICWTVLTDTWLACHVLPLICPHTAQASTDSQTDARHRSYMIITALTSNTEALQQQYDARQPAGALPPCLPPTTQASADALLVKA